MGALGTRFLAIDMIHVVHGCTYLFILMSQWLNFNDVSQHPDKYIDLFYTYPVFAVFLEASCKK